MLKRILVTGGAGFIGSNMCEYLLKLNHEVVCLDNFITGRRENIDEFLANEKYKKKNVFFSSGRHRAASKNGLVVWVSQVGLN